MRESAFVIFIMILLLFSLDVRANWLKSQFNVLNNSINRDNSVAISSVDKVKGLKEVLRISMGSAIDKLGRVNGFYKNAEVRIPLPEKIERLKNLLEMVGLDKELNKLELQMNRAAEKATPKAKKIFIKAIEDMSFQDARKIIKGPDNAATEYFRKKMTPELRRAFRPIIRKSLYRVGAIRTYREMLDGISDLLPFTKSRAFSFTDYVMDKTIDGIFYYMAKEEKQIRENPAKRTTELLKKIFGFKSDK